MDIDKKAIGARIKSIRQEKGLTLQEFGNLIGGADRSVASRWERGVSLPNNARLKEIADEGGVSVNELLYGDRKEYISNLVNSEFDKFLQESKKHIVLGIPVLYELYKDKEEEIKKKTIHELTDPASLSYKASYEDLPSLIYNHFKTMISFYAENNMILLLKLTGMSSEMKNYLESSYGESQRDNDILSNSKLNREYYKILSEKINDLINTIDELYLKEIHIAD